MAQDTIYALSTAYGAAGVAVIRVSGPAARDAALRLCGVVPPPRVATLRVIRDPRTGSEIDSAVLLFFPSPASFTGEDIVEFQTHGSVAVCRQVLRCLGELGLRAAEAGEFSLRAFHNGKMDLVDVEALGDLLSAETEAQLRLTRVQRSNLHQAAGRWRGLLLEALALTEAHIDFSDEEDVVSRVDYATGGVLAVLQREIDAAIQTMTFGERLRRGVRIAIAGPPNAGKSSLLNALAARDVAITSPVPGTTRDVIEVHLDLGGFPVVLVDTAGLRQSSDEIEAMGIERAQAAIETADLVLWLTGIDQPLNCPYPDAMVVRTKADLIDSDSNQSQGSEMQLSVLSGFGMDLLVARLTETVKILLGGSLDLVVVAHERQAGELRMAVSALRRAVAFPVEMLELRAEELRRASRSLDRLTGRIDHDEVLGAIFSRFCIGK